MSDTDLEICPNGGYQWAWTGFAGHFGPTKNKAGDRDYYPAKTLWDWLQLFLIPLTLAVAGFLFNRAQQRRELKIADIRQQEAALEAYLGQIANLLLDKKLRELGQDEASSSSRPRGQRCAQDMGPRPSPAHSLHRVDNDRDHEPGNVVWATWTEHNRNTRKTHWVLYDGRLMSLAEACQLSGINHQTVRARLRNGWPVEDALSLPVPAESPSPRV